MKKFLFARWLNNISIQRKWNFIIALTAALTFTGLFTLFAFIAISPATERDGRWLENGLTGLLVVSLIFESVLLTLIIFLRRSISFGINEILRTSETVAKNNFTARARVTSNDEMGMLADAFNRVIVRLKENPGKGEPDRDQQDFIQLRRAERKFRNVLEAAPNALVMIDKKGKVKLINQKAEKLFGYEREELVGKNIRILVAERLQESFPVYWTSVIDHFMSGKTIVHEFYGLDKEGREFPVEININPVATEDGMMVLSSIVDITMRKKDEDQLREAKEKAEQMSQARQEFLSVMSHEMRTPLNAVVGITHLLLEDKLTPEQTENVNILHFSSQNLLALINNILDFSKIESGKLHLEKIEFNLNELVRRLVDSFKHSAQEKQVKVILKNEADIPDQVTGDPVRITQVLTNLLHNAIKFTEQGEVCLSAETVESHAEKRIIRFEIADTGIGIEPNRLNAIFDSYTQAKPSITRQFGGTGLGLTICKKLINMMGGEIKVESEVNKGSVFSFELEFAITENSGQKQQDYSHEKDFNLKGVKVLLVEDNVINKVLAKKFITRWGASVDTAVNGLLAIDRLNESEYDIVLMDLQMPVMDGYKANRIIREMGYTSEKLPVIALTAYMLDEVKMKVRAAGMNDYLSKPIDPHELYRKIVKNIKRKKRNEDDSFLIAENPVDVLTLEQLLVSFDSDFRKEFLQLLEREFSVFASKIAAVAWERNSHELRQIIHKITPSLKRFDHQSLSVYLEELKKLVSENAPAVALEHSLDHVRQACNEILSLLNQMKEKFIQA